MKLTDLLERREDDHILDMIEDYLMTHNFKLKVHRAIDGLEEDQFEKLKGMLFHVAQDNYDYATDTGPSIHIPEENVIAALHQMRAL